MPHGEKRGWLRCAMGLWRYAAKLRVPTPRHPNEEMVSMATVKEMFAALHEEIDRATRRSQSDVERLNKRLTDAQAQLASQKGSMSEDEIRAELEAAQAKIAAIDPTDSTTIADAQAVAQSSGAASSGIADAGVSSNGNPSSTAGDPTSAANQ